MKTLYFLLIIIFFILSCNSHNYSLSDLQKNIIQFTQNGNIDQDEYDLLKDKILSSKDEKVQRFQKEGTVKYEELNDYIVKYAKTQNIKITTDNIWSPDRYVNEDGFSINVFVENSASMDGYMNDPSTQFKNSIYSLLTRLKTLTDGDSLNLYFINKHTQLQFKNATNSDVEKFKDVLNPKDFKNISLGLRGETDMKDLMAQILAPVDNVHSSVFIIDGVFSPGNKYNKKDAALLEQYLTEQKIGITSVFESKMQHQNSDLSAVVLQMQGGFSGTYYFPDDTRINFSNKIVRPFYIWFMGTNSQIEHIIKSKKLEEIDGGYLNKWVLRIPENKKADFKIQYSPKIGSFDAKGLPQGIIQKARSSKNNQDKGKFGFGVAVNFSKFLKDDDYFLNVKNYNVSNPEYRLEIDKIEDQNNPALNGFTHVIKFETDKVKDEDLEIELLEKMPDWIKESTSVDDSKILTDKDEQSKTFGLQYLMEGVGDAFYPRTRNNVITSFKIKIKK